MSRDKKASHIRVNNAIKEEFLEKGYMGATIRGIGKRAGMTSAGLYRHYQNKEAMFAGVVEPLINSIIEWMTNHRQQGFDMLDECTDGSVLFNESFTDMIIDIVLPNRDEFKILFECSKGSKYENFISDFIADNKKEFVKAYRIMKERGYPVKDIEEAEIEMLMSANVSACFLPIIQDYDDEKIEGYMKTLNEFFIPGWKGIFGVN